MPGHIRGQHWIIEGLHVFGTPFSKKLVHNILRPIFGPAEGRTPALGFVSFERASQQAFTKAWEGM